MIPGALARMIRGERLELLPGRALCWPARRLLVVADTHFGKSAIFGQHGLAVPAGTDALDRQRISHLLDVTRSQRLLVLGDFLHGELRADSADARHLAAWLVSLQGVQVQLVIGNHDRVAAARGSPAPQWQGEQLHEGPFCFTHDADAPAPHDAYRIGGHIHPVVAVGGLRKRRLRVPVFWEREDALVLPSFGLFTGGYRIEPADGGVVFAAGDDAVLDLHWEARRARGSAGHPVG